MGARILVCDDDASYCRMLEDGLGSEGYSVVRTGDAGQLVQWIAAFSPPDLFILDFQMPGGGGPAAVRRLRSDPATARVPIIICSGMPVDQQSRWFAGQPLIAFVKKPFVLSELAAVVKRLLAGGAA